MRVTLSFSVTLKWSEQGATALKKGRGRVMLPPFIFSLALPAGLWVSYWGQNTQLLTLPFLFHIILHICISQDGWSDLAEGGSHSNLDFESGRKWGDKGAVQEWEMSPHSWLRKVSIVHSDGISGNLPHLIMSLHISGSGLFIWSLLPCCVRPITHAWLGSLKAAHVLGQQ